MTILLCIFFISFISFGEALWWDCAISGTCKRYSDQREGINVFDFLGIVIGFLIGFISLSKIKMRKEMRELEWKFEEERKRKRHEKAEREYERLRLK